MASESTSIRVAVLSDGGTCTSLAGAAVNGGRASVLGTRELLKQYVPDAWNYADLYLPEKGSLDGMPSLIDSTDADLDRLESLAKGHFYLALKGYHRQVQLRGTDTLDYASGYLYLRLRELAFDGVVCITGAQLGPDDPGSDVPRNVRDAIFAATKLPPGVYCVFAGKILDPRKVTKVSSTCLSTFEQTDGRVVGCVDAKAGRLELIEAPTFVTESLAQESRDYEDALVITVSPFMTPAAVEGALRQSSSRGVIVQGYGLGGIPQRVLPSLAQHREKVVVLTTQCAVGGVNLSEYEVGRNAESVGALTAGCFSRSFTRVLLNYLLARFKSADQVRAAWQRELTAMAPERECAGSCAVREKALAGLC